MKFQNQGIAVMVVILNLWYINVQMKGTPGPEHGNAMSLSRVSAWHWGNKKYLLLRAENSNKKACCGPKQNNLNFSDKEILWSL
jgi:hypothetical protein